MQCSTAWAYLSQLIPQYNEKVSGSHPECVIADDDIVVLRNALAHGIAISISPSPPLRLIKFGSPNVATGKVKVDFVADMTDEWLEHQQRLVQKEIEVALAYIKSMAIGQSQNAQRPLFHLLGLCSRFVEPRLKIRPSMFPSLANGGSHIVG